LILDPAGGILDSIVGMTEESMSLQFIGEVGIYLPERDAVKIIAIAGDRTIDCTITRSALDAIGCTSSRPDDIVRTFEARRIDCEIAAMAKYRRATTKLLHVEVTAADLAAIERSHAA
jgi:hypothetical protein